MVKEIKVLSFNLLDEIVVLLTSYRKSRNRENSSQKTYVGSKLLKKIKFEAMRIEFNSCVGLPDLWVMHLLIACVW